MTASVLNRVRQIISDVFSVDMNSVTAETHVDSIAAWDSMAHLNLVLSLEQDFGISFTPEQISELTSVKVIVKQVEQKTAAAAP